MTTDCDPEAAIASRQLGSGVLSFKRETCCLRCAVPAAEFVDGEEATMAPKKSEMRRSMGAVNAESA